MLLVFGFLSLALLVIALLLGGTCMSMKKKLDRYSKVDDIEKHVAHVQNKPSKRRQTSRATKLS